MSDDVVHTCTKEKCPLWKEYGEKCPHYMLSTWVNESNSQPTVLQDCAPRRSVRLLMDIHNDLRGMRQYASQTRTVLDKLCDESREFMIIQRKEQEALSKRTRNIETVTKKLVKNLIEAKNLSKKIEAK